MRNNDGLFMKPDWKKIWNKRGKHINFACTGGRKDKNLLNFINNQVLEIMNFQSNDIVLDIGCGGGSLVNKVSKIVYKAVGIDLSNIMISYANVSKNTFYIQGNMQNLPFKEKCFSKIVCISSLMYIPENSLEGFFSELNRIITKDGSIFLGQLLNKDYSSKLLNIKGFNKPKSLNDLVEIMKKKIAFFTGMLSAYSPDDIESMADKFGFQSRILKGVTPQSIYIENYYHFSIILEKYDKVIDK